MNIQNAIEECQLWLEHLESQRNKSKRFQELAHMARNGQAEEAQRLRREIELQPQVYDMDKLAPAIKCLLKAVATKDSSAP